MNTTAHDWLRTLVAFDTTSRNSNLHLIETVRDALNQHGLPSTLYYSSDRTKANLFATLPAQNGGTQGGIVLSGHTDVVPVDGQDWHSDPFTLTEKDGAWYGRGTADMKGFIATALSLVPEFLAMPRQKPLHLALSYDEEVGCLGAPVMLKALQEQGQHIDGCVVGEPTGMQVVVAHKGINAYQCHVHGHAAHSSLTPQGCNAIEYAAQLICRIREIAEQFKQQGPYDRAFDVPYTTMTTNMIAGGIALNTIPDTCQFSYEFRNLPGMRAQTIAEQVEHYVQEVLLPRMRSEYQDARIEITSLASAPALEASEQDAITALARALTKDTTTRKVAYATEAGLFQQAGIPSIICGPGHIQVAHKANEYVEMAQIQACAVFLRQLSHSLCPTA
ncbi:acetylornithine deacetylase [Lampropedia puyangensis]|uniref:Acetylornithine deacetylase n=1 Tax=Lampropedia puyangensis TaxID=1330072 RepID=A0A4S8F2L7_9BURK|nr:acetylornithine deacetylase [Lampropedia puyangensis]THU01001.1 acetylornithine deacetylase [Lampropedia puyangensis]